MKHTVSRSIFFALVFSLAPGFVSSGRAQQASPTPNPRCTTSFPLPNASDIGSAKFEEKLYAFLDQRCYQTWIADRQIRNSGPFINNQSFGTHNAVKVFYSSEVWNWLKTKNREGE